WIAVVFFSVLVHELGHAWVSVLFGYRPAIQLVWTGGLTQPNGGASVPWHRDVLLTLAGPGMGLLLAGASFMVRRTLPQSGFLHGVLGELPVVNLLWSLFNLVPVLPMDGGRVAHALLMRLFGRRGFLLSQLVSLIVCLVAVALLSGVRQSLIIF